MALPTRVQRNLDPYEAAQHEFDSMIGRWFGNRLNDGGTLLSPFAVDVREDADHLYVEGELPGFKKEEVDINIENQTLTITAERKEEKDARNGKSGTMLLQERRYTRFQRSFNLPPTVDTQTVQAKLNDGILTVTLNKREDTKPKRIAVS
jgi:HSP20 family protein